jgi:predicted secreted protein
MTSFFYAAAIYFVLWWLVLFAVLPWGVRSQHEGDDMPAGTDPGAPQRPLLVRKALATTIISTVLFAIGYAAWAAGWLALDRFPMPFELPRR